MPDDVFLDGDEAFEHAGELDSEENSDESDEEQTDEPPAKRHPSTDTCKKLITSILP